MNVVEMVDVDDAVVAVADQPSLLFGDRRVTSVGLFAVMSHQCLSLALAFVPLDRGTDGAFVPGTPHLEHPRTRQLRLFLLDAVPVVSLHVRHQDLVFHAGLDASFVEVGPGPDPVHAPEPLCAVLVDEELLVATAFTQMVHAVLADVVGVVAFASVVERSRALVDIAGAGKVEKGTVEVHIVNGSLFASPAVSLVLSGQ